jgi:hypothetical protein
MLSNRTSFTEQDLESFAPAEKIGLVASANPDGLPHLTLITSIMAQRDNRLTLGQFCDGLSKQYIQQNPRIAFLVMTMEKKVWQGKARWTHLRKDGPEYERYNNDLPMFRYNTYFGIHTVHYLDLVELRGPTPVPLRRIILEALLTRLSKNAAGTDATKPILKPFAEELFNQLDSLKFLSYVGPDGFPELIPFIQCQAADSRRLAFAATGLKKELGRIPAGTTVAVFCLNMKMEDVLVRGRFGVRARYRGVPLATVDIDWVYNSMPPCHGQIYPEVPLRPVTSF